MRPLYYPESEVQLEMALHFRQNIRTYNTAFAFTSFGGKIDHDINQGGRGPYIFRVNGEVYHQHGSLLPDDPNEASYAQLYFYDAEAATDRRLHHDANLRLRRGLLLDIHNTLLDWNHLAQAYYTATERIRMMPPETVSMQLQLDYRTDLRRYNLPAHHGDTIAAIVPNQAPPPPDPENPNRRQLTKRDIIVHLRRPANQSPFQRVDENSGAYDPMYYTMLFPCGELGWHWDLRLRNNPDPLANQRQNQGNAGSDGEDEGGNNNAEAAEDGQNPLNHLHEHVGATRTSLTRSNYYAYRLHERPGDANTLLSGGKLLQQYIADGWATIEQGRLNWIYFNQDSLRADLYSSVADAIEAGEDLRNVGQPIILPASHTGSPRYMLRKCQDSLAIASHYGAEDLFITMTANPNWPEIQSILKPNQTAADVPHEVSRVFHLKVRELLQDILKNGIFGRAVAHVYTIEFQKRGLPHMHLLVWLAPEMKPRTVEAVDKFVSAEFPDPEVHPELHEIVTRVMLHGPCGTHKPDASCMVRNRCSKGYPKPFQEVTQLQESGYPLYQRQNNGRTFERGGFTYTNQWVVPYNPYLSRKYNCHINVEICNSIRAIKYIHKYIYKGHDRITVATEVNEVKRYLDARWIGPHEASWRIFEFRMHAESPPVQQLSVHLEGQQPIVYDARAPAANILQAAEQKPSTLMAFFKYYSEHPNAEKYLYSDFPQHFVWQKKRTPWRWTQRQRGFALGRMPFISPRAGERFYLRLLLTVVPGM
jgi:hypothetical protein